jgi:hypothetical protein
MCLMPSPMRRSDKTSEMNSVRRTCVVPIKIRPESNEPANNNPARLVISRRDTVVPDQRAVRPRKDLS